MKRKNVLCIFLFLLTVLFTFELLKNIDEIKPQARKWHSGALKSLNENHSKLKSSVLLRNSLNMSFDIDIVISSFKKSVEDKLNLEQYNRGYNELYSFFLVLGTVFKFIASDVREKIDILESFQKGKNQEHYTHTEKMIIYEIQMNKDDPTIPLLGSRTLLRLHRALKFTYLFLDGLILLNDDDNLSSMAITMYNKSLANHHPWLIRNAAKLAMYSLPNKKTLINQIAKDADKELLSQKLREGVAALEVAYKEIEDLYTKNNLHSLP
ncbi:ceramide-1-phosphate transfer protein [Hydra vulgaris]|uniref:Glycolipid transfer protein domain-containing protein 1 n=1 Tax=Hydra vulgaris TaxID=6087 RepID=T2MCF5_HYDVU|nr:ceramide-1-phosphate transfer protein-like [Hydra vulgaris]